MNHERINQLIAWVRTDLGEHLSMNRWVRLIDQPDYALTDPPLVHEHCKTAYCLCGHANFLRIEEEGRLGPENWVAKYAGHQPYVNEISDVKAARDWLGLEITEAANLFHMPTHGGETNGLRTLFDKLPGEQRARIVIDVLEGLLAGDGVRWYRAFAKELGMLKADWMLKRSHDIWNLGEAGLNWEGAPE